ncbi:hypothetical protein PR202_ga15685 [Eleusine coracana subsp. coracana]|uniref:K+ potassium transporter integral membrane domain-containing protein n=1 Tax=Eleusine coracana subsp. coracana TaxID=191504 RepID=A0AAV5CKW7_ELECO|nr:hypothetical protein PR202_ga15685 [Eleusine coracana subsp. coracana]
MTTNGAHMDLELGSLHARRGGGGGGSGDTSAATANQEAKATNLRKDLLLAYKTLGVVFGGLVTSPLYVYPSMNLATPTLEDYLGIYSIMFWTLTLIGVVKYACIALNADDHGEGVLPSKKVYSEDDPLLYNQSAADRGPSKLGKFFERSITARRVLLFMAIMVLSAIDGLRGPFPSVSKSAEAMFADLGHFSKKAIQIAFLSSIYPSLVLTYAGQTAYLINNVNDFSDGFYKFVPGPVYWPMFVIATLASIVASQSLISATFSVIKQSVVLDYFPRVKVVHTSEHKEGEVYSPETNYILMILCVGVTLGFGGGKEIGNAFGVVVIMVMLITTILLTLVMDIKWRTAPVLVALYFIPFFIMEGCYVSAVFTKIPEGGWLPFAVSVILALIMFVWYYGRQRKTEYEMANKVTVERLGELLASPEVQRVPGLCFFYSNIQDGLTPVVGHYIKNNPDQEAGTQRGVQLHIQYGYADSLVGLEGGGDDDLAAQVTNCLRQHIQTAPSTEAELAQVDAARAAGKVHVRGKMRLYVGKDAGWFDRVMLGSYEFLHGSCRSGLPALGTPLPRRVEIGMLCKVD